MKDSTARRKLAELTARTPGLSTGVKVFLILGIVLLPFAILSTMASNAAGRSAAFERQARVGVIADGMARRIDAEMLVDLSTLSTLAKRQDESVEKFDIACREASDVIDTRRRSQVAFIVVDGLGEAICRHGWIGPTPLNSGMFGGGGARANVNDNGTIEISRPLPGGRMIALRYAKPIIATLVNTTDLDQPYNVNIEDSDSNTLLKDGGGNNFGLGGTTRLSQPVGNFGLDLILTTANPPPSPAQLTSALLPVAMWLISALFGWLLVDRLFIRDLRNLTREVGSYEPGEVITTPSKAPRASEVKELGSGLNAMSQLVADNLNEIGEGLERQTALTREVHHRVKNNLQVVASLINLHARGDHAMDAKGAYRLIQRRVDALSVVHRNHFAGYEESHGVSLRTLLSELAGSLQASSQSEAWPIEIKLDVGPGAVNQDVATSVAFLVTELTELALYTAKGPTELLIQSSIDDNPGHALLSFCADGFRAGPDLEKRLEDQYLRILTGLSRQLRAALDHDGDDGVYSIEVPVISASSISPNA